jgi:LIM domain-binding protein 1
LFSESNRQPNKRRKRKGSATNNASMNSMGSAAGSKQKRSPGPQAFNPGVSAEHTVVLLNVLLV